LVVDPKDNNTANDVFSLGPAQELEVRNYMTAPVLPQNRAQQLYERTFFPWNKPCINTAMFSAFGPLAAISKNQEDSRHAVPRASEQNKGPLHYMSSALLVFSKMDIGPNIWLSASSSLFFKTNTTTNMVSSPGLLFHNLLP
jgi:hypothetical protein